MNALASEKQNLAWLREWLDCVLLNSIQGVIFNLPTQHERLKGDIDLLKQVEPISYEYAVWVVGNVYLKVDVPVRSAVVSPVALTSNPQPLTISRGSQILRRRRQKRGSRS